MADLSPDHKAILRILSVQSPSYDAFPNATCFVVDGHHSFHHVARILEDLAAAGLAQRYVYDVIVKPPHEVLAGLPKRKRLAHMLKGTMPAPETEEVPGGYEITDAGRALAAQPRQEAPDA